MTVGNLRSSGECRHMAVLPLKATLPPVASSSGRISFTPFSAFTYASNSFMAAIFILIGLVMHCAQSHSFAEGTNFSNSCKLSLSV